MIRIRGLTLGRGARTLLERADATIAPGERIALVGANGSGKSTLLAAIAGELSPESGAIADSLGWFYFKKGWFEKARDELLRAETLIEEQDAVIFDHIGQAFYQTGETERAIEYLEKAVALDPEKAEYSDRLQRMRDGTEKKLAPSETAPAAVEKKE